MWTGDQEHRGARDQLEGGSQPESRLRSCLPRRPGLSAHPRPSSDPRPVHTTGQTCWKNRLTTKPKRRRAPGRALALAVETFPSSQHPRETEAGSAGVRSRSGGDSPRTTGLREDSWNSSHLLLGALGPQCAPEPLRTLPSKQPDRPSLAVECRPERAY